MSDETMKLHPRFTVPVPPGSYTARLSPDLDSTSTAAGGNTVPSNTGIPERVVHIDVEGPQWSMEPNELFGAFPPANSRGPFAARLAQAVLRRKTLPWERSPSGEPELPWVALVVLADGEANYLTNVDPIDAYTEGAAPAAAVAASNGSGGANAIEVSETVIDRAFPARSELHLLCHGREIDLTSTEYGSSDYVDDDGIVSVVIANRLPLPGTAYRAYLISLEGQHDALRPTGGPSQSTPPIGHVFEGELVLTDIPRVIDHAGGTNISGGTGAVVDADRPRSAATGAANQLAFVHHNVDWSAVDLILTTTTPTFRFPVLASWSFECDDAGFDFAGHMQNLDVALVSTVRDDPAEPDRRRPVTLTTGHAQLDHITRRGDRQPAWYRGPLTPSKVTRDTSRPMAHISDQLLKAVAEGSLDLSLAAAFELGRMLAMSDATFIKNLRSWARSSYSTRSLSDNVEPGLGARFDRLLDLHGLLAIEMIPHIVVGDLFGGSPGDPWPPDVIDDWRIDHIPPVPIHSAVRLVDSIEPATLATGLGLDATFVAAALDRSADFEVPDRVGLVPAEPVDFDQLVAVRDSPLVATAFERTHRIGIANREAVAQVFVALDQAGFEIEADGSGLIAEVTDGDGLLASFTPQLNDVLIEAGELEIGGGRIVNDILLRNGGL